MVVSTLFTTVSEALNHQKLNILRRLSSHFPSQASIHPSDMSAFNLGHAGAMLQAKQLGTELLVGIHSDAAILHNKGPTVMTLDER